MFSFLAEVLIPKTVRQQQSGLWTRFYTAESKLELKRQFFPQPSDEVLHGLLNKNFFEVTTKTPCTDAQLYVLV